MSTYQELHTEHVLYPLFNYPGPSSVPLSCNVLYHYIEEICTPLPGVHLASFIGTTPPGLSLLYHVINGRCHLLENDRNSRNTSRIKSSKRSGM